MFTVVDAYEGVAPSVSDRYGDVVRLAEAAEAGQLSSLWVAEHHFQPGGVCPAPPVLLAACAARTQRLRLGVMVSVLPFHRPIELAEQYAMVDRLSGGRLNLGVGSGYIPLEFEGFGVDPASKRERFDRNLETLLAAFDGREVRADEPGAVPVRINVLPVQRPHPPLWIAVQRREAIPFVARRGVSLALVPYATVANLAELGNQIREFRAQVPAGSAAEVAVAVHLYAGIARTAPTPRSSGTSIPAWRPRAPSIRTRYERTLATRAPRRSRREGSRFSGKPPRSSSGWVSTPDSGSTR